MTPRINSSAVVQLVTDVTAFFEQHSPGTLVVFGVKKRWSALEGDGQGNRLVIVPGKVPGGEDGQVVAAVGPGEGIDTTARVGIARPLFNHTRALTFCCWAADTNSDPGARDELAQVAAIEDMFEVAQQAVKRSIAGEANAVWGACKYNTAPNEIRFGTEYLCELELGSQWFDLVPKTAFPTTAAVSRGALT